MNQYVDVYTFGDVQTIGKLECIPVLLDEETLRGSYLITNGDAVLYSPATLEANGTLDDYYPEPSLFRLDYNTPNGKSVFSHILRFGSFIENSIHTNSEDSKYVIKNYIFFLPSLAVDVTTYNTLNYKQTLADAFFNGVGQSIYTQPLVRWILRNHADWYERLFDNSNHHVILTWVYQETTNSYIPVVCVELCLIGTGNYTPLTDGEKESFNLRFCHVINEEKNHACIDIKGTTTYYWDFEINANINTDEPDIEELQDKGIPEGFTSIGNIESNVYDSEYNVPANPIDLYLRTFCFRSHVTYWGTDGMPKPINDRICKYLDPNCYAYTQPVWRLPEDGSEESKAFWTSFSYKYGAGGEGWFIILDTSNPPFNLNFSYSGLYKKNAISKFNNSYAEFRRDHWGGKFDLNNTTKYGIDDQGRPYSATNPEDSWLIKNGYLSVSAAWFPYDAEPLAYIPNGTVTKSPISDTDAYLQIYTKVPNGLGHNPENGDTIGLESPWCYNYPNGIPAIGLREINQATQSAVCFTNVLEFNDSNAQQTKIHAYTEKDDFESTIIKGTTPSIVLSVKGQNVGRMNLETNTVMTRW